MKILLLLFLLISSQLFSQENGNATISGFVFEEASYEALIGANVYLENQPLGGSTNNSGYYVITNIPAGKVTLVVSFLGYKTHRQNVDIKKVENLKINIVLKQDLLESETIVVTADSIPIADQLFEKQISTLKLSSRQINSIPQIAEADLLRSLQTLPGILPLSDFSSALYIRGGTPDQNLYLIDGTDVYNPEHAFGLFSTFNTDAIKQVDLSKGGFSAEKGGRLSSIIDVTNIDGNRKNFQGKAGISLLSARTTLQTPLGDYGSLSGSIRRTYFDQTIARAIDDIPDYYFYDGNLKAFFDIDGNNNLTISGYGGRDLLDIVFNSNASGDLGFKYDWGNQTGSIKWAHIFNPRLFANFWVTASRFSSFLNFEGFEAKEENILNDITLKGNLEYHHSNTLNTNFGFEQKNFDVRYLSLAPGRDVIVKTKREHYVAYLQSNWQPSPLWDLEAGLRFNFFNADSNFFDIAPRFAAKYRIDDKSTIKFSTGLYHQYLHRIPRFLIADIWTTSSKKLRPSTSVHYILGYQRELPGQFQLEVEAYHKSYKDIYSFDQNFLTELQASYFNEDEEPVFTSGAPLLNRGDGITSGFEILLRKESGLVTGWAGYSIAETEYTIKDINQGRSFKPRHDRTHTVNLITNVDLDNLFSQTVTRDSSRWGLGVNFVYSTGQPITEPGSAYYIASSPDAPFRDVAFAPTKINQIRLPDYARLDVSVTWTLQYETWKMAPYIQIFNIGNRQNVWFATYGFDEDFIPELEEQYMFPLLPTFGVNFEF
ncbi:MAG: TonB-dependent receptor [Calditrichaeota bacterium]|nr:MAG: TonB-dependent receptor [Calditrichota bacterium]MBL1205265.1 TonB-dependent receptor [Calditrichota bacterium]NOG45095.1 TonB-dependent receptor [Calditrichota bacterium]